MGWWNPLKNPLRPLIEVAYSVQAFDWSGQVRPESCQVVVCLTACLFVCMFSTAQLCYSACGSGIRCLLWWIVLFPEEGKSLSLSDGCKRESMVIKGLFLCAGNLSGWVSCYELYLYYIKTQNRMAHEFNLSSSAPMNKLFCSLSVSCQSDAKGRGREWMRLGDWLYYSCPARYQSSFKCIKMGLCLKF